MTDELTELMEEESSGQEVSKKKKKTSTKKQTNKKVVGLDIGTGNIVAAIMDNDEEQAEIRSIRNMFVDAAESADLDDIDHIITQEGKRYIFGEHALRLANIFGKICRRPMAKGVISTSDIDAIDIIALIIENVIGKGNNDICVYSVPSQPIDSEMNITYHVRVLERILKQLGYKPIPISQALAVCYSQCESDGFSAIINDFGAGMGNVSLVYKKNSALEFSTSRGGDWIDSETGRSLGINAIGRITSIKENNLDLSDPMVGNKKERRVREALSYYYESLITYALDNISSKFDQISDEVEIMEELPIIISGGTSKAEGFLEFYRDVFEGYEEFPINIKEIRHASDPLTAVAEGALIFALSKEGK